MDVPLYQEAINHFLAGIALSAADRYFSGNATRRTSERMERKLEQLAALEFLGDSEKSEEADVKQSPEYLGAIAHARDYFKANGKRASLFRKDGGLSELPARLSESYNFQRDNERINNQPISNKFGIAFGLEFLADGIVAVTQTLFGAGNTLSALGESLYQGPAMFGGFLVGKTGLWFKDLFRSKDEKEADELAKALTKDGKILAMVREYNPVECIEVQEALSVDNFGKRSNQALTLGVETVLGKIKTAGLGAGKIYDGLSTRIRERREEKKAEEARKREELRSRYENY